jgi:site-specific DNA-methyltransferase (adenine-specific)
MELLHGDCREMLKQLPDASVDSIVTDPPYELGFMGKSWDSTGVAYDVTVWRECLRVLKPGGHLLAFGGSRTYHRLAVAIEDAGFQIRDQIMWVYGSGFPKSLNISKAIDKAAGSLKVVGQGRAGKTALGQSSGYNKTNNPHEFDITEPNSAEAKEWDGWGTALKPAHEPIVMARKPLDGTVANNVLTHGTGGINIDGCRVGNEVLPEQTAGQAQIGTFERTNMVTPERIGRFPANFIHDGLEEVLELFPDTGKSTGGRIGKKSMGDFRYVPTGQYEAGDPGYGDSGSAARFFYCAKASKAERNAGLDEFQNKSAGEVTNCKDNSAGLQNPRAGAGRTTGNQNFHPTVKPIALMRYLVRLVTPPNGTVLDPFAGSGTTLVAATMEKFDCIGIEMTDEYLPIIEARVAHAITDTLF